VGRALPTDFGHAKEQLLRQFNIQEPVTGGVDPLADRMLEENDYREAVESLGLPDDPATWAVYTRLRRKLLYDFEFGRDNELTSPGADPASPTRAFEKRVTTRLTIEENRALSAFVREELEADHVGIHLGDPAAAGPVRHETPFGTKREAGPVLDNRQLPLEAKPSDVIGLPETAPKMKDHGTPSELRRPMRPDDPFGTPGTPIFREDAAPVVPSATGPAPTPHTYSLSIRPGETKTQVVELPGLTLALTITMPSMLPRPV
jgi:hypothetical protein